MKKLIFSALMALSCGALFAADTDMYLFWMISDNATVSGGGVLPDDLSGYTARISDGSGSNYLTLYSALPNDGGTSYGTSMTASQALGYGFERWAAIGGYDSGSFFVELLADGSDVVAYTSEHMTYAQLASYMSPMKGQAKPADAYGFSTFTAVPEPTSGLLLLLGVAGLALRRKKMQKA